MNDDLARLLGFIDGSRLHRRTFLSGSVALGMASALSLGKPAFAGTPKQGGILKIGLGGGATSDSLDPGLAASSVPLVINYQWGDTLVGVTPDGKLVPRLAESFESNVDASEWTFKIREGVIFHDGSALTAEDVSATYRRHSDENASSGALGIMKGIKEITADGMTLVIKTDGGNADLPYLLSDYHLMIQPKGGVDNPTAAIGTGAYKLVSAEAGVRLVFEKNKADWDTNRGFYDGVEITVINDSTARNAALQAGQVHMINRVDPKVAKLLGETAGLKIANVSGRGHYVFVMHCDAAPFDNKDLRLALKYAINRQEMVDKILNGYGSVGNDIPINAAYPLFDDTLEQRPFDPAKATEHYKASGHDGSPIELLVANAAFPGAVEAAELWQASANAAGIPLVLKRVPDDGYWSDVWNVKPFEASYWDGRPVQDQMYSTAYLSTAEWNDTRFKNAGFDALILQGRAELDPEKRKAIYSQLAKILWEEGGVIVPMFNDFVDGYSEAIAGWVNDPNHELMGGLASQLTWMA